MTTDVAPFVVVIVRAGVGWRWVGTLAVALADYSFRVIDRYGELGRVREAWTLAVALVPHMWLRYNYHLFPVPLAD